MLFLYTMSIFEGKTAVEARQEVSITIDYYFCCNQSHVYFLQVANKFLTVYSIGFVYWPIAQTINFAFVPARNQVIFVSVASLIWTTFLAYMKVSERDLTSSDVSNDFAYSIQAHQMGSIASPIKAEPRNESQLTTS